MMNFNTELLALVGAFVFGGSAFLLLIIRYEHILRHQSRVCEDAIDRVENRRSSWKLWDHVFFKNEDKKLEPRNFRESLLTDNLVLASYTFLTSFCGLTVAWLFYNSLNRKKESRHVNLRKQKNEVREALNEIERRNYIEGLTMLRMCEDIGSLDENMDFKISYAKGFASMKLENYDDAIEYFTKALKIDQSLDTYAHRAYCYLKAGNLTGVYNDMVGMMPENRHIFVFGAGRNCALQNMYLASQGCPYKILGVSSQAPLCWILLKYRKLVKDKSLTPDNIKLLKYAMELLKSFKKRYNYDANRRQVKKDLARVLVGSPQQRLFDLEECRMTRKELKIQAYCACLPHQNPFRYSVISCLFTKRPRKCTNVKMGIDY